MTDKDEPLFGCSDEFCASEVSYPANLLAVGPDGRRWCEHCYDEHLPDWDEETPPWQMAPKFVPQFQATVESLTSELDKWRKLAGEMAELLARYRKETPLGHQPHMIAHLADVVLAAFNTKEGR